MTDDNDVTLAIGRLNVTPGDKTFLREALLTSFRRVPGAIPVLKSPGYHTLRRTVLLAEIGSDAGKELRWKAETHASKHLAGQFFSQRRSVFQE